MLVSAVSRAPLTPLIEMAPPVETEYCATIFPTSNVFAPLSVTVIEMGVYGVTEFSKSAQRPPQPVSGCRSGIEVCHWVTWSAWEKSCGGLARDELYWALVIG